MLSEQVLFTVQDHRSYFAPCFFWGGSQCTVVWWVMVWGEKAAATECEENEELWFGAVSVCEIK